METNKNSTRKHKKALFKKSFYKPLIWLCIKEEIFKITLNGINNKRKAENLQVNWEKKCENVEMKRYLEHHPPNEVKEDQKTSIKSKLIEKYDKIIWKPFTKWEDQKALIKGNRNQERKCKKAEIKRYFNTIH